MRSLRRLYCRVRGHRWVMLWQSHSTTLSTVVCVRCRENGWQS